MIARPSSRTLTLDGLRGIAVLAVVLEHAWPAVLPGGFAGVDVFFVLSGYLITRILVAELDATGRIDAWTFYARRVRRILPASMVAILGTVVLYLVLLGPALPDDFHDEALAATFSVSNILFANRSVDYFASDPASSPFLHFWSLAVEEQFYLVWPAMLAVVVAVARRVGRPAPSRLPLVVVALVGLASLALALRWNVVDAFFLLPARGWELIAGGLFAWVQLRGFASLPVRLRPLRGLGVVGGYALLAITFLLAPDLGRWPGAVTILPVLGTWLLVAGGDNQPGHRVLTVAPLQFFGRISYALYLWHWPLLAGAALLALPGTSPPGWVPGVAIGIAILVATASTILLEEPIRSSRRPTLLGRRAVVTGLASMAGVGLIVAGLTTSVPPAIAAADPFGQALATSRTDRERIIADRCITGMTRSVIKDCIYGAAADESGGPTHGDPPSGMPVVVLFGDSHAMHWFPALDAWAREEGYALVPLTRSACPPADVPLSAPTAKMTRTCTAFREKALQRIAELHPALTIVSGSLGTGILVGGDAVSPRYGSVEPWIDPATRMLAWVNERSVSTVLLGDVPRPAFNAPDCLAVHRGDPGTCAKPLEEVQPMAVREAQARAAAAAGVPFLDPTTWLCGNDSCTWLAGGAVGWVDGQHLTSSGALHALPALAPLLDEAIAAGR